MRQNNVLQRSRWLVAVASTAFLLVGGGVAGAQPASPATGDSGPVAAACGQAPTLRSGTHTIQSSGKSRSFILSVPDNYDPNRRYRLVFGFHWLGGTAAAGGGRRQRR